MAEDRLYFRQLLAGRDFAQSDRFARQMVNFAYLIGDRETGEAVVVDAAYDVQALVDIAAADGMRISGALVTHYHQDHVGGNIFGNAIQGLADLLEVADVPVHAQRDEVGGVRKVTGVEPGSFIAHDGGDVVEVGAVRIELLHTPGHTPGSQCFLVEGRLVSGDTLFLEGCGRTDLPGGDPEALYHSLTGTLAKVPDTTVLYPGHLYAPQPSLPMGEVRRDNYVLSPPRELPQWLAMFGR
jgi:glyoxylase-like metal-dependent hydrolase (beta-lactamase superfamily II)